MAPFDPMGGHRKQGQRRVAGVPARGCRCRLVPIERKRLSGGGRQRRWGRQGPMRHLRPRTQPNTATRHTLVVSPLGAGQLAARWCPSQWLDTERPVRCATAAAAEAAAAAAVAARPAQKGTTLVPGGKGKDTAAAAAAAAATTYPSATPCARDTTQCDGNCRREEQEQGASSNGGRDCASRSAAMPPSDDHAWPVPNLNLLPIVMRASQPVYVRCAWPGLCYAAHRSVSIRRRRSGHCRLSPSLRLSVSLSLCLFVYLPGFFRFSPRAAIVCRGRGVLPLSLADA